MHAVVTGTYVVPDLYCGPVTVGEKKLIHFVPFVAHCFDPL
jgi:hypothetical protein